jgi:hypothetical protein
MKGDMANSLSPFTCKQKLFRPFTFFAAYEGVIRRAARRIRTLGAVLRHNYRFAVSHVFTSFFQDTIQELNESPFIAPAEGIRGGGTKRRSS